MSQSAVYVTFLLIAVVLVLIDGQVLYRNGRGYLSEVYDSPEAAAAANRMTVALFHLVVLGVVALLAAAGMGSGFPGVLARIGIALLLLAVAHGVTMAIYGWLRARQRRSVVLSGPESGPAEPEADRRMPHVQRRDPYVAPSVHNNPLQ